MPELPEVERTRRMLEPAMRGATIERVRLGHADQPLGEDFSRTMNGLGLRVRLAVALIKRGANGSG